MKNAALCFWLFQLILIPSASFSTQIEVLVDRVQENFKEKKSHAKEVAIVGGLLGALLMENPDRARFKKYLADTEPKVLKRKNIPYTELIAEQRVDYRSKLTFVRKNWTHVAEGAVRGSFIAGIAALGALAAVNQNDAMLYAGAATATALFGMSLFDKFALKRAPSFLLLPTLGIAAGIGAALSVWD